MAHCYYTTYLMLGVPTLGHTHLHRLAQEVASALRAWATMIADRKIGDCQMHDRIGNNNSFSAWVSFPDPHHPFDCPEPWSWLHKAEEVDLPEHRTRDFERRPWRHDKVLTAEPYGDPMIAVNRKPYSRIVPQSDEQLCE